MSVDGCKIASLECNIFDGSIVYDVKNVGWLQKNTGGSSPLHYQTKVQFHYTQQISLSQYSMNPDFYSFFFLFSNPYVKKPAAKAVKSIETANINDATARNLYSESM